MARIGWLGLGARPAFQEGMAELGYVEGQHYVIEYRDAPDEPSRLREPAAELMQLPVDVMVVGQFPGLIQIAREATATIPIVIAAAADPVASGLVASLGRPGGNVTGTVTLQASLGPKRLELMKEALPGASRLAVLFAQGGEGRAPNAVEDRRRAAEALGAELLVLAPRSPAEYEEAMLAAVRERDDGRLAEAGRVGPLVPLAAEYRLPTIYYTAQLARDGCLMSYGASLSAAYRRAAYDVHRILQGTKPADLPLEQPTRFDFVINL